jgi:hypothetical protein
VLGSSISPTTTLRAEAGQTAQKSPPKRIVRVAGKKGDNHFFTREATLPVRS